MMIDRIIFPQIRLKKFLNFNPKKSIDDAVKDLIYAFEKNISKYF